MRERQREREREREMRCKYYYPGPQADLATMGASRILVPGKAGKSYFTASAANNARLEISWSSYNIENIHRDRVRIVGLMWLGLI